MNTNGMIREIEYLGSNGTGTWINFLDTPLASLKKTASDSIELSVTGYLKRAYGWNNLFGLYSNNPGGWILKMAEYPELRYWYAASQSYDYLNKLCNYTVYYGKSGEGSKLLVDGKIVFESTSILTFNGLHPTYQRSGIFSASGSTYLAKGSYFCGLVCKKNGVKVMDLVPVRVGQVGYAYDKVTKTLYPSSGTGSFVLGPDVAKPVIGLYGMHGSKSIDYTRNGLVALYDGIDNAGYNKHDSNATVWKDLTDNHYDLTSNGTPSWRYNGAYINAKANSFHRNSCDWFRSLWSSSGGVYVECVCSLGREIIFGFGGQQGTYESFDFTAKTVNNSTKYCNFILGNRTANTSFSDGSIGRVYGWANASSYKIKFNNASELTGSYTYQTSSKNGLGIGCRGDNYGNAYLYNGVMHRIAVYSRALSPAEIAHNYAIDKARFNL